MKTLILLLLSVPLAHAQSSAIANLPHSSGVEIVKHSWSKERINWERDPFAGVLESFDDARMRMRNEKRIEDAKRGSAPDADRIKTEARADDALIAARHRGKAARYVFSYKVSLRNSGAKTIKAIDWDYAFFDAATKQEVGRHQFTSEAKVEPGKRKEFGFLITSPPSKTISVYALNDKERQGLTEQIILVRVVYADGSVWQRAPEPAAP